jgi:nucleoside-diphosphate-sugar epimerase
VRVLVAGATSTLGRPVLRTLRERGHEVVALTRSRAAAEGLDGSVVADVLDREDVAEAVRRAAPEAVISLLIALPRRGPMRISHFRETVRLWSEGVPNLLEAAREAGARRFVCESVVFAYGYGRYGTAPLDETSGLDDEEVVRGQERILGALRAMERGILAADTVDGIVLRYGLFHGRDVPSSAFLRRMIERRMMVLPGGGDALLSWIEIEDAARATVDALERGRAGEVYNVVDDEPVRFRDYTRALAASLGVRPPRSVPMWLARLTTPYSAAILGHTELPVSNAKAKRELGWAPAAPSYREVVARIAAAAQSGSVVPSRSGKRGKPSSGIGSSGDA